MCFKQIGTKGEDLSIHTVTGSSTVEWKEGSLVAKKQPLTWYKVREAEESMNHAHQQSLDQYNENRKPQGRILTISFCSLLLTHQQAMNHWL